jgi:hypothetical protein
MKVGDLVIITLGYPDARGEGSLCFVQRVYSLPGWSSIPTAKAAVVHVIKTGERRRIELRDLRICS